MDYPKEYLGFLHKGLLNIIKSILFKISNYGLEGKQNLIIRFHNNFSETSGLGSTNDSFTTISIQSNLQSLHCTEQNFSINVNINGVNKRLTIPFEVIALIMDPSARFGIEFSNLPNNNKKIIVSEIDDQPLNYFTEQKNGFYYKEKHHGYKQEETNYKAHDMASDDKILYFDDLDLSRKPIKHTLDGKNIKNNQYQKDYLSIVRHHMIEVVRNIINCFASNKGKNENLALVIEFKKEAPGVILAPAILNNITKYGDICTIILQHQFFNLMVYEDYFTVMLSFDNNIQKISIPFKAINRISDPVSDFKVDLSFVDFIDEHSLQKTEEKVLFYDFSPENHNSSNFT